MFDREQVSPTCAQGKQRFCKRKVLAIASKIICLEKSVSWQPFHAGTCLGPKAHALPDLND